MSCFVRRWLIIHGDDELGRCILAKEKKKRIKKGKTK